MGWGFSVPNSILSKINAEHSSDEEKMSAAINYIVTIIPDITWEKIATSLFEGDEEKAVKRVKPYLHILPGGSCFNPRNTAHSLNTYFHIIAQPHLHHKVYLIVIYKNILVSHHCV